MPSARARSSIRKAIGESQATWLLAKPGEDADVIGVGVLELVMTNAIREGFAAAMEKRW